MPNVCRILYLKPIWIIPHRLQIQNSAHVGQNSVFEADLDYSTFLKLKAELLKLIDEDEDSLRFYYLGNNWKRKVEHVGAKKSYDPEGVIIL